MAANAWGALGALLLGAVMAFAAISKAPRDSRTQLRTTVGALTGQQSRGRISLIAAVAIATELVTAAVCFVHPHGEVGPLLYTGLMAVYLAVVSVGYARNVQVPCACFGRSSQDLLGLKHVLRNGGLLAPGVLVLALNEAQSTREVGTMAIWIAITLVAVMSFAALLLGLAAIRSTAPDPGGAHPAPPPSVLGLSTDGVGLETGEPLPLTRLAEESGRSVDTGDYRDRELVTAFFVPNCPACTERIDQLSAYVGRCDVIAIVVGPQLAARRDLVASLRQAGVQAVVLDDDAARFADACGVDLFPTVLYFDHGIVAELPGVTDAAR
jgi:hypothetical protein